MHGLGANPDYAWTRYKDDIKANNPVNWLSDLLPRTLLSNQPSIFVCILCFDYQSAWYGHDTTTNRLETVADGLLDGIQIHKVAYPLR